MRTIDRMKFRLRNRVPKSMTGQQFKEYNEFIPPDAGKSDTPYGNVCRRAEWGAVPPLRSDGRLTLPVLYIKTINVFMEAEGGGKVEGLKGPSVVQKFQKEDMAAGLSDIRSNFIIDEDGVIYEGRGWAEKPAWVVDPEFPEKYKEYLEIAYIGDFQFAGLDHPIHKATASLMQQGIESDADLRHPAHFATAKLIEKGHRLKVVSRDANITPPVDVMYERKYEKKIPILPVYN